MPLPVPVRAALERWSAPHVALAVAVACVAGLAWRQDRLGDLQRLASRGWHTSAEAAAASLENVTVTGLALSVQYASTFAS